ncbi:MAG: tRNA lysidine(34) synthetase TilS [Syntrophaceae bacterium]|nr:tRNA lysidine(34) synthetase TilS [Syntrophaceae bacterium]
MVTLLDKVRETLNRHAMLTVGDHVLAAVSGGRDSVALLKLLVSLAPEYRLRLTVGHFNHGLRGEEAEGDADFVRQLAGRVGVAFASGKAAKGLYQRRRGRSVEEIAREERYRFLEATAAACGASRIATGHHRRDQAETLLLHLIRGCGLEGLRGIPPVREGKIIRPLLYATKQEIEGFLRREGLPYREDSSNQNVRYLRNRIRQGLLPELADRYNPQMEEGLARLAEIVRRDDDYLQSATAEILQGWDVRTGAADPFIPLESFRSLHEALQARVVKGLLEACPGAAGKVGYRHVEAVLRLCQRKATQTGRLDLPCAMTVMKEGDILRLRKDTGRQNRRVMDGKGMADKAYAYPVTVPGTVPVPEAGKTFRFTWTESPGGQGFREVPSVVYLAEEGMIPPLVLRNFRPGDRITPLGMRGTKKVHDVYIDQKIPRDKRGEIPLLADAGSVLWIAGRMISERVKVTGRSLKVLKAEMV